MGVSAFGFEVFWSMPVDDGGRDVTGFYIGYRVQGSGDPFSQVPLRGPQNTSLLIRNGGDPSPPLELVNSTTYE